jgi:hypothetical protein
MKSKLTWFNLSLRAIMEMGIVLGLGYWGFHMGESISWKLIFAVAAPLIGFGFWGAVDFHQIGRLAEVVRLLQELVISGLAALALYVAGQRAMGWVLATLSIVYHAMVYLSGGRLLKHERPGPRTGVGRAPVRIPIGRQRRKV